ncbi:hypothetical protein DPMN_148270 [Dreissena polymorpha]|uniref:Uncharacterized protein n=1 Tax=Dreissena polymorpha TaxID=45954 RepID=A0A9D4FF79_DREPO|nr:hypothetical protein DPMN_148270 [Dreissena polymorpha]
MLTKWEPETGKTLVTILGSMVQISILRDRSETDMIPIGASILGGHIVPNVWLFGTFPAYLS